MEEYSRGSWVKHDDSTNHSGRYSTPYTAACRGRGLPHKLRASGMSAPSTKSVHLYPSPLAARSLEVGRAIFFQIRGLGRRGRKLLRREANNSERGRICIHIHIDVYIYIYIYISIVTSRQSVLIVQAGIFGVRCRLVFKCGASLHLHCGWTQARRGW